MWKVCRSWSFHLSNVQATPARYLPSGLSITNFMRTVPLAGSITGLTKSTFAFTGSGLSCSFNEVSSPTVNPLARAGDKKEIYDQLINLNHGYQREASPRKHFR